MASSISQIKQQVNQIGQQAASTAGQLAQLATNLEKNIAAVNSAIGDKNIAEISEYSIIDLKKFMDELMLTDRQKQIGRLVLKEIRSRLGFLVDVGLDYLSLARATATLSGGEAQRIRLATQIGSGLVGVAYILDEPSIGLHQRDNDRLIAKKFTKK